MVYCAADTGLTSFSSSDIAFPHQIEMKINGEEVKANLRGLKNKAGSTRPADITPYLRKKPGYQNSLVVTYALTTKVSLPFLSAVCVAPKILGAMLNRDPPARNISSSSIL